MRRSSHFLVICTVLAACGGSSPPAPVADGLFQLPGFADAGLAAAVRDRLASTGLTVSSANFDSLTDLSAASRQISDLAGIEQLRNLTSLDLSDNAVVDLAPLSGLAQLQFLDLSANRIVDLTPLSGLTRLQTLVLARNQITDATPLTALASLQHVNMLGNPIDAQSESLTRLLVAGVVLEGAVTVPTEPVFADTTSFPYRIVVTGRSTNNWWDLFLLSTDGSAPRNITQASRRYESLSVSPDGRRLAYVSDWEYQDYWHVWTVDVDGGAQHQVTPEAVGAGAFRSLHWSPTGERIVLQRNRFFASRGVEYSEIRLISPVTGEMTQLTALEQDGVFDSEPRWSPDGSQIAFIRWQGEDVSVLIAGLDGTTRTISQGHELVHEPRWDPTGQGLVFSAGPPEFDLIYHDLATGQNTNLTNHGAFDFAGAWSPDGSHILFESTRSGGWSVEILRMNRTGADLVSLTPDLLIATDPQWTPDGRWIVFREGHLWDESAVLHAMRPDGSGRINLTNQLPGYRGGEFVIVR